MRIFLFAIFLAFSASSSAVAAPPPPLSPEKQQFYDDFFNAFPKSFPTKDLTKFGKFVADDLVVTFDDGGRFDGEAEWFAWLNSLDYDGKLDGFSMTRKAFYIRSGDRILVHETWHPILDGKPTKPWFPQKFVSYKFKDNKLVQVDYIAAFREMGVQPGAKSDG